MKKELDYLIEKVNKIDEKLGEVDKHLAVYNEQLVIHIKAGEAIHEASLKRDEEIEDDLKPIKDHVYQMRGAGKLIAVISLISGTVLTIYTLLGNLN